MNVNDSTEDGQNNEYCYLLATTLYASACLIKLHACLTSLPLCGLTILQLKLLLCLSFFAFLVFVCSFWFLSSFFRTSFLLPLLNLYLFFAFSVFLVFFHFCHVLFFFFCSSYTHQYETKAVNNL